MLVTSVSILFVDDTYIESRSLRHRDLVNVKIVLKQRDLEYLGT